MNGKKVAMVVKRTKAKSSTADYGILLPTGQGDETRRVVFNENIRVFLHFIKIQKNEETASGNHIVC
jgi:hypothetical protein